MIIALYALQTISEGKDPHPITFSGTKPHSKEVFMALIDYVAYGDYLLPCVRLGDPLDAPPLGRYAQRRQKYLKE